MMNNGFISGYGVKIEASINSRFTIYRAIATPNARADFLSQKVKELEDKFIFLDYKAKKALYDSLWREFSDIADYSSPNQSYLSTDLNQLIDNLLVYSKRGPIRFVLNEYDLIPNNFNELAEVQQLLYIIKVKFVARRLVEYIWHIGERYALRSTCFDGVYVYHAGSFGCSMSHQQISYLLKTLKRTGLISKSLHIWQFKYFFTSDTAAQYWDFEWKAGTATLIYFFHRLFLEKYILNCRWHITLSKYRKVITKQGNRLTFSNSTTNLHNIISGQSKLREKGKVDLVLKKLKFYGDEYASKH